MERRENQDQPLGICHKLFNFFMKNLVEKSLKRIGYIRTVDTTNQVPQPIASVHQNGAHSTRDHSIDNRKPTKRSDVSPEEFELLGQQDNVIDKVGPSDASDAARIASAHVAAIGRRRWIPVEDNGVHKWGQFRTIPVEEPDYSTESKPVGPSAEPDHPVDGHIEAFIKRTRERIRKSAEESNESDGLKSHHHFNSLHSKYRVLK